MSNTNSLLINTHNVRQQNNRKSRQFIS